MYIYEHITIIMTSSHKSILEFSSAKVRRSLWVYNTTCRSNAKCFNGSVWIMNFRNDHFFAPHFRGSIHINIYVLTYPVYMRVHQIRIVKDAWKAIYDVGDFQEFTEHLNFWSIIIIDDRKINIHNQMEICKYFRRFIEF